MIEKRQPYRNKKITQAANGESCTITGPTCNYDCNTTVFAHYNDAWAGKGTSQKADDIAGAFACSNCHDFLDGRTQVQGMTQDDKEFYWRRGNYLTIRRLLDLGILR